MGSAIVGEASAAREYFACPTASQGIAAAMRAAASHTPLLTAAHIHLGVDRFSEHLTQRKPKLHGADGLTPFTCDFAIRSVKCDSTRARLSNSLGHSDAPQIHVGERISKRLALE